MDNDLRYFYAFWRVFNVSQILRITQIIILYNLSNP